MARTTRKKSGRKTTARRKTARRTSTKAKRSAAAKKAARTRAANKRKRSAAAKKAAATRKRNSRRKTAKRSSSKRKTTRSTSKAKRSRAAKKAWATRRRNASKRSRAAKRGASKRKRTSRRKPATRKARRTTTRRTSSKAKRSRAAKKGWATRRRNSGRRGAKRSSKRRTSRRRTSRRRSSKMFGMSLPKMKGLKGGLRTLMMGGLALGLVGGLVYFPLNLVSAQTGAMVNSVSGLVNKLPISANNAQDIITVGTGILTLAVGGMILNAAKRRKMFSAKTQGMLPTALVLGTSAYTVSKLQTANIGASFNQLIMGQPVAAAKTLNQGYGGRFSAMLRNNSNNNAPLPQGGNNGQNGARLLGMSNMAGKHMGGHGMYRGGHLPTAGSNALYQNNSANAGRIFGARLGSAKRKVNLF